MAMAASRVTQDLIFGNQPRTVSSASATERMKAAAHATSAAAK
jgi:hypothetical protein